VSKRKKREIRDALAHVLFMEMIGNGESWCYECGEPKGPR
jgi:hypothetical protein